MTLRKEHNFLTTNLKEMEIYEMPWKAVKIIILRNLGKL
jgi:hypothetical protein